MRRRRIGALLASALIILPLTSGCLPDDMAMVRAVRDLLSSGPEPLSEAAQKELAQFDAAIAATTEDSRDVSDALRHFGDALEQVRRDYVRPVDDTALVAAALTAANKRQEESEPAAPRQLVQAALEGMLHSLDPHSDYMDARAFDEIQVQTRGEFGGLGIEIAEENDLIKVISPIEDTPASRAGILPGDAITHLEGESIRGLGMVEAVQRMRGPPGTRIRLTVLREGVDPFDVTLERAVIRVRSVRWRLEKDIGYIRVSSFTEQVQPGIERAMSELTRDAGGRLAGLVLDLRTNPGGLLDQSVWLSDAFIDEGLIVETRGRRKSSHSVFEAEQGDLARGVPMLVLVNVGSASAAEIVAAALQDSGRARVMGTRTYGKGSVQTIFPLPREGGLRLTTALHYRPSGQSIQALGVMPDIIVAPEEPPEQIRREADLPGAFTPDHDESDEGRLRIPETSCPAREDGDRILGCALLFLRSGREQAFLAAIGQVR